MTDILIDNDGEIIIEGNDIAIGFSDFQHQEDLLILKKGEIKELPTCGVGIENFLNESDIDGMLSEVKSQFINDGMDVQKLSFDEATNNLDYEANY